MKLGIATAIVLAFAPPALAQTPAASPDSPGSPEFQAFGGEVRAVADACMTGSTMSPPSATIGACEKADAALASLIARQPGAFVIRRASAVLTQVLVRARLGQAYDRLAGSPNEFGCVAYERAFAILPARDAVAHLDDRVGSLHGSISTKLRPLLANCRTLFGSPAGAASLDDLGPIPAASTPPVQ